MPGKGASPTIVIHSLDHARAALAAAAALGAEIALESAAGGGCYAGAPWFKAIVDRAMAEYPAAAFVAVLDCSDEAGSVLAAFRHGLTHVRFTGSPAAAARLADIAAQLGATLVTSAAEPPLLDLANSDEPDVACRVFLARNIIAA